jgi:hypothetical protein
MHKFAQIWLGKLGAQRADVLVRGLGFMLYLTCLGHWGRRNLSEYLEHYPASSLLLGLWGFALMVAGARLITFVFSALTGAVFLCAVLHGLGGPRLRQQAAEYPMLMLIPATLAVLALTLSLVRTHSRALKGPPSDLSGGCFVLDSTEDRQTGCVALLPVWQRLNVDFEHGAVLIFRWAALTTLFFAGFHKLNTDFFTPLTSCESVVKQYAARNWSLPGLDWALAQTSPGLILLMESAVPILLLLFHPPLGVLTVTLFQRLFFVKCK